MSDGRANALPRPPLATPIFRKTNKLKLENRLTEILVESERKKISNKLQSN